MKPFLSLLSVLILIITFQNCGDVGLNLAELPVEQILRKTKITGQVCGVASAEVNYNARTVFVVDMSLSNLGRMPEANYEDHPTLEGVYMHRIITESGTDLNGGRFDLIQQLITAGNQSGSRFSVIGFGKNDMLGSGDTCSSPFYDGPQATNFLTQLKNTQRLDLCSDHQGVPLPATQCSLQNPPAIVERAIPAIEGSESTSPFQMGNTNYNAAFSCLKTKIENEITRTPPNQQPIFNVIFLTDGKPSQTSPSCDLNCMQSTYRTTLSNLKNQLEAEQATLRFHSFFYSNIAPPGPNCQALVAPSFNCDTVDPYDESAVAACDAFEYCAGSTFLDTLSKAVDPQSSVITGNNFSTLQTQMASLLRVDREVTFNVRNVSVVNLTAINQRGVLLPDSNMNGIPDGSDTNSTGDIRAIYNSFPTINASGDVLPSFIKKIRGLNAFAIDGNANPDRDSFVNSDEVLSGRDPLSSEALFPTAPELLTELRFESLSTGSQCDANEPAYQFDLQSIGLVPELQAFQEAPGHTGPLDFSHAANENLLFFYYMSEPTTGTNNQKYLFGALKRLQGDIDQSISIRASEFINLGVMP